MEKETLQNKFLVVAPQIVGTADNWGMSYDTDWEKKNSVKEAVLHGLKTLSHDDFWVVEITRKESKAVAIYHSDQTKREDCEEELRSINEEFGN